MPGPAHLCRDVLRFPGTPEFRFYRGGNLLHIMNGADKAKLEANVQDLLQAGEFGARSHLPVNPTASGAALAEERVVGRSSVTRTPTTP